MQNQSRFIHTHRALVSNMVLSEIAFWAPAQAELLREKTLKDADWAEVINQLNTALHQYLSTMCAIAPTILKLPLNLA